MKRIALSAAILASLFALTAQAAQPSANFNVNINLASVCSITTAPGAVAFTYTSFGGPKGLDAPGAVGVTCTKTLLYTLDLDNADGLGAGSYKDATTDLTYTLSVAAPAAGTGGAQSYAITGNMPGSQAGLCASSSCTSSNSRTLTVSY
jgi:spore coat protein U-like protein